MLDLISKVCRKIIEKSVAKIDVAAGRLSFEIGIIVGRSIDGKTCEPVGIEEIRIRY
ncbi:MAG: hypothetical protein BWY40_00412 [bacterium ADurb.Bin270]|nr:MAG: hypothetical protein BWY40_00412 [bacterium ADurb.Bin270]